MARLTLVNCTEVSGVIGVGMSLRVAMSSQLPWSLHGKRENGLYIRPPTVSVQG